ncbi:hypothetical protein CEXT_13811 [Caerostris extrusa]|uniref:Uncharacterized protein n=1 Tax=Caerostris extrusa TaxID=172846 RepID=A0AAV4N2N0_CAEEX|nr:hypothetical protein CEXT_13811 [Caerostris extrusa]
MGRPPIGCGLYPLRVPFSRAPSFVPSAHLHCNLFFARPAPWTVFRRRVRHAASKTPFRHHGVDSVDNWLSLIQSNNSLFDDRILYRNSTQDLDLDINIDNDDDAADKTNGIEGRRHGRCRRVV